jgi:hypothetical protein
MEARSFSVIFNYQKRYTQFQFSMNMAGAANLAHFLAFLLPASSSQFFKYVQNRTDTSVRSPYHAPTNCGIVTTAVDMQERSTLLTSRRSITKT